MATSLGCAREGMDVREKPADAGERGADVRKKGSDMRERDVREKSADVCEGLGTVEREFSMNQNQ